MIVHLTGAMHPGLMVFTVNECSDPNPESGGNKSGRSNVYLRQFQ
jgi:hypothetical protein